MSLGADDATRIRAVAISPEFFETLGVTALAGRLFTPGDLAETSQLAVISERLWRGRFDGRDDIVGQSLVLNGRPFAVTGVVPGRVQVPGVPDVWIPGGADEQVGGDAPQPMVVVRLRDAVTLPDARAALVSIRAARGDPEDFLREIAVTPFADALAGDVRPVLLLIAACAVVVLLVSCSNVANLLLIRIVARDRELAVRRALGASLGRLTRHLLFESLVVAGVAAALALPIAIVSVAAAGRLLPDTLHGASGIGVDARAFALMTALALLAGIVSSAAPALAMRRAGGGARLLPSTGTMAVDHRGRARAGLVVVQIAAALVLLAGAVTIVHKVAEVMAMDLGVRGENALTFQIELPRTVYQDAAAIRGFYTRLEDELARLPGTARSGVTSHLPGAQIKDMRSILVEIEGTDPPGGRGPNALEVVATPGYFDAIGMGLLAGRAITPADGPGALPVAVVSADVAAAYGLSPAEIVGRRMNLNWGTPAALWAEIVGVSSDVRMWGPENRSWPTYYVSMAQYPTRWSTHVVVRGRVEAEGLGTSVRNAVARVDPGVPIYGVRTFDEVRATFLTERRLAMTLMLALGTIAIGLAALGLYGTMAHAVARQTRELGIRMALGASRSRIRLGVLGRGGTLAGMGVALGSVCALSVWSLVSARIANIGELEPGRMAGVAAGIVLVALLSAWLPAHRATRLDPVIALRAD